MRVLWDWEDDPEGNVQHIAEHGITQDEVEEALANVLDEQASRSSERPMVFGETAAGRLLVVVYEIEHLDGDGYLYPITAYDADLED